MRALYSWRTFDSAHGWEVATDDVARTTTLTGPQTTSAESFCEAIPSWAATTPAGTHIDVQLRTRCNGHWTTFYRIAQWDDRATDSVRQSFDAQRDDDGRVATDTLKLNEPGDAFQLRVVLHGSATDWPQVRALYIALSAPAQKSDLPHTFSAHELTVPHRSQMDYPNGRNICSPTSLTMLLAYWAQQTGDTRLAPFAEHSAVHDITVPCVYDPVYEGHGNWGFNTAYAASLGLDAYVARLSALAELEPWIAAGVPLALSVAWQPGELTNAPASYSNGHLTVLTGFDGTGGAHMAEPRGDTVGDVRRVYPIEELELLWQRNSQGTVYIVHPLDWPIPTLAITDA